jgi:hypothetical protein
MTAPGLWAGGGVGEPGADAGGCPGADGPGATCRFGAGLKAAGAAGADGAGADGAGADGAGADGAGDVLVGGGPAGAAAAGGTLGVPALALLVATSGRTGNEGAVFGALPKASGGISGERSGGARGFGASLGEETVGAAATGGASATAAAGAGVGIAAVDLCSRLLVCVASAGAPVLDEFSSAASVAWSCSMKSSSCSAAGEVSKRRPLRPPLDP